MNRNIECMLLYLGASLYSSVGKESVCNAGDLGSIPGLGRSPGEGNGNPLQYSCLENPMDRGAWQAIVHGVTRVGHDLVTKSPPPPSTIGSNGSIPFDPKTRCPPGLKNGHFSSKNINLITSQSFLKTFSLHPAIQRTRSQPINTDV